jgi:hypothetical protein
LYLETATVDDMKNTAAVVIEMVESMKIAVKVLPGSIRFELSLIGQRRELVVSPLPPPRN